MHEFTAFGTNALVRLHEMVDFDLGSEDVDLGSIKLSDFFEIFNEGEVFEEFLVVRVHSFHQHSYHIAGKCVVSSDFLEETEFKVLCCDA